MSVSSHHPFASSSKGRENELPSQHAFANESISDDEDEEPEEANIDLTARETMLAGMLKSPVTGTLRAIDLHQQIHQETIDLRPDFQREVVWPTKKQIGLILSMAQNYPIPPIYFSLRTRSDGSSYRVCLDGKQRLTSLRKFFDGLLPFMPDGSNVRYYFTGTGSGKRNILPDNIKRFFEEKPFTCVEYNHLTDIQERDMFQRVQLGMPLKEGEKLQSIGSEWASWCSVLVREYVENEGGLSENLSFSTERGRAFQIIGTIVAGIDSLPNFSYRHYGALDKYLRSEEPPRKDLKVSVEKALSTLTNLATTPTLKTVINAGLQRFSPVEFVFMVVLIHMLKGKPQSVLAKEIKNLRDSTRRRHEDIRANNRVITTLWEETRKICDRYEGGGSKGSRQIDDEEAAWSMNYPAKKAKRW